MTGAAQILAEISKGGRQSMNSWALSNTTSQGCASFSPGPVWKGISVWFWLQSEVFGLFGEGWEECREVEFTGPL